MTQSLLFKTIRRIQIVSTRLAKDILAGAYRSAFKGRGMEFEEVREYMPGDEVRSIDWNVTARMNHPYVKNFREERDLNVFLLVDVSASERFGSHFGKKSSLIAEIGAVLAFSAIRNNDRIGMILFSDQIEAYIPPRKGTRHVLRMIRDLLAFQPKSKGSNLKAALSFLGKVQSRSCICFVLSDFQVEDYSHEASIISQHHDLIGLCITDPFEHAFPKVGVVHLANLETGAEAYVDTSSATVQKEYQEKAEQHRTFHKQLLQSIGAAFVDMRTDRSYIAELNKFFTLRKRHPR